MKKRRSAFIYIVSSMLILLALVASFIFKEFESKLMTLLTTATAIIGVFAVYIQIRKGKLINQSSFLVEFSKFYHENPVFVSVCGKFGKAEAINDEFLEMEDEDKSDVIEYLNWIKTLATLVNNKTLNIDKIDSIFFYQVFLFINNKSIQEKEIIPFAKCYRDVFILHKKWVHYRREKGLKILGEENDLSKLPIYENIIIGKEI